MHSRESIYKNHAQREYTLNKEQKEKYQQISKEAIAAKKDAVNNLHEVIHQVNTPNLNPDTLMPKLEDNNISTLSLFSGGGGLDYGFDRAGFIHKGSYELIPICGETLKSNRPEWTINCGPEEGDVTKVDWNRYKGKIDVIHGGPPCQPFSVAGQQKGQDDERNMWGEFTKAVNTIKPKAFVAENVLGLLNPKFEDFVNYFIIDKLKDYHIVKFEMNSAEFGVPQIRRRVFFVGFRNKKNFNKFIIPKATHTHSDFISNKKLNQNLNDLKKTIGLREALGLDNIGYDNLSPTLRSGFTGKRNTTSILNSSAAQVAFAKMGIWGNGVQLTREKASFFPAKNKDFRLSVQDCAIIQGFPESWKFSGAVYQIIGQIGNSVSPPVAYAVAKNLATALKK